MSQWKGIFCLLAILAAYGLVGNLDYQDAIALEEALREDAKARCAALLADARDDAPSALRGIAEGEVSSGRAVRSVADAPACGALLTPPVPRRTPGTD
ncbi:MAG: hypothetical protein KJ011_02740 [Burkholderiaceae bacterium]|nr:hypothetical protein [Burkholderiaceae bacterium]